MGTTWLLENLECTPPVVYLRWEPPPVRQPTRQPARQPARQPHLYGVYFVPVCSVETNEMDGKDQHVKCVLPSFLLVSKRFVICLSMMIVMTAGDDDACTKMHRYHLYLYVRIYKHVLPRE